MKQFCGSAVEWALQMLERKVCAEGLQLAQVANVKSSNSGARECHVGSACFSRASESVFGIPGRFAVADLAIAQCSATNRVEEKGFEPWGLSRLVSQKVALLQRALA